MKKGVSPVIATALLVGIVIILAAIVFLWARGFISEKVAKFDEPVERSCERVDFETGVFYTGGNTFLDINNRGDVPIYSFNIKTLGKGEIKVSEILENTIGPGESHSIDISGVEFSSNEIIVIPVLLAESEQGKVAFTCEDQFGVGVSI